MTWFYDPRATYEDNLDHGPFGLFADAPDPASRPTAAPEHEFLGLPVHRPFGIPAGPLVNAAYCDAAFRHHFDVAVYKTVRTAAHPCHPFPNTLAVHVDGDLEFNRNEALLADDDLDHATSISNSFGVPSRDPDAWQPDMARAVASAGEGQVLVGSFQGTRPANPQGDAVDAYIADHVTAARLTKETGAPILEMNLSCPNEGTGNLLCFDTPLVARIAAAVKDEIGDTPLVLKMAYFGDEAAMAEFLTAVTPIVDGLSAINTIPARLVDAQGRQALPGAGREVAGVCGSAIGWAARDMVARISRWRADAGAEFALVGVGGVMTATDAHELARAGADCVMSATGAMIDPLLGAHVAGLEWPV
ncbi:hypothetical protein ON058_03090 [Demequina sp. B12]|uniref:hypothetical protein n=1 Tax=Demequina sp. B12 TaxID=2992757 RepID=UPI00237C358D|nr:hypothetical protein [Demequina sp. B12]MDE0572395.1 hypothetical protein [Demequina sp. B12]